MMWLVFGACALIALLPTLREWRRVPMNAETRKSATGKFANLPQGTIHYQWLGAESGPVAVCVHGLTTPSYVYHGLAKGLGEMGFRVLVYDHYGRGYSDRPKGLQDAAFFIKNLEDLLADQDVEDEFTLIGYSMGGAVVSVFAAKHAARLHRLILLAPAGMGHDLGRMIQFMKSAPFLGRWLMHMAYPSAHKKGCEAERTLPTTVPNIVDLQLEELGKRGFIDAVLSSMRGLISSDMEAIHRKIATANLPVLAIWGADDAVIPLSAMEVLKQRNPKADNCVIKGAGHGLPYTHTDAVLAALRTEK